MNVFIHTATKHNHFSSMTIVTIVFILTLCTWESMKKTCVIEKSSFALLSVFLLDLLEVFCLKNLRAPLCKQFQLHICEYYCTIEITLNCILRPSWHVYIFIRMFNNIKGIQKFPPRNQPLNACSKNNSKIKI